MSVSDRAKQLIETVGECDKRCLKELYSILLGAHRTWLDEVKGASDKAKLCSVLLWCFKTLETQLRMLMVNVNRAKLSVRAEH